MKNPKFHQLLRARGLDVNLLADLIDSVPSHVSQVLNNRPGRGGHTRRKLFPWILPAEAEALGWGEQYREWLRAPRKHLRAGADMRPEENSGDTETRELISVGEGNTHQLAAISPTRST